MRSNPIRIHRAYSQQRNGLVSNTSRLEIENLPGVRLYEERLEGRSRDCVSFTVSVSQPSQRLLWRLVPLAEEFRAVRRRPPGTNVFTRTRIGRMKSRASELDMYFSFHNLSS